MLRLLANELLAFAARFLILEILDQALDRLLVLCLGLELQILLEAEDRLVEVTEVSVALTDVVEERRQRLGIERGLLQAG